MMMENKGIIEVRATKDNLECSYLIDSPKSHIYINHYDCPKYMGYHFVGLRCIYSWSQQDDLWEMGGVGPRGSLPIFRISKMLCLQICFL